MKICYELPEQTLTNAELAAGRIIEWQFVRDFERKIPWFFIKAAFMLIPRVDYFILDSEVVAYHRLFRRWLMPKMYGQVCAVGADKNSPLQKHHGFMEQRNWRLRMSMADAAFF